MTLKDLYAKRATAWEAAKNFLDTHRMESGLLSGEDAQMYDRMEKEITDLTAEIQRLQNLESIEAEMRRPVNSPLFGKPGINGAQEEKKGRASNQYRQDMLTALRTQFRQVSDVLEEGTDSAGGYLVPAEWDDRLIETLEAENVMRKLGTIIKTTGERKIPVVASKPTAAWIDEGESLTFGDETFGQKVVDAYKLHAAVKVTEELLYDNAFNLESHIIAQCGKALGSKEEEAFMIGNGSGKPTGIFDATNGGTAAVSGASITADKILDLVYALKRPYRKNASFIMRDATIASVRKLKDGNGAYMWQPSYQAGEPDRLCGYAINPSEYAPEAASGKSPIAFGDFSYYNIGDRGVRSIQILRELFAGNGMVGYVAKERVDGILVLKEAVQLFSLT